MGETGEAPAPVDQGQLSEMATGGLREASETAAGDCYNSRAIIEAVGASTPEPNGTETPTAGGTDGESSGERSDGALSKPDNGEDCAMDVTMNLSGGELSGVEGGDAGLSSDPMNDPGARPSDTEPGQSGSRSPDGGEDESNPRPPEDPLKAHWVWNPEKNKMDWDAETKDKMKKLDRKRMFSSNYMLPTDFSGYFDIRSGEGPKQALEPDKARAGRLSDEMKAWRKKIEEQCSLTYNRRAHPGKK